MEGPINSNESGKSGATSISLPEVENKLKMIEENFKSLSSNTSSLHEKLEQQQMKMTEIMALFVTLFTFIAINFNLLPKISDLRSIIIVIVVIMLACTILITTLFCVIQREVSKKTVYLVIAASAILGLGIILTNNPKLNPEINWTNPLIATPS
jgi:hypothetical protein